MGGGSKMRIAIRFAVSTEVGYGHATRCLALAQALAKRTQAAVRLFAACDERALGWLKISGFPLVADSWAAGALEEIPAGLLDFAPDVAIVDLPQCASIGAVERIRASGALSVLLDDIGPARLAADLCFVPTQSSNEPDLWRGAVGRSFCGPLYALVRSSIASVRCRVPQDAYRVLVMMGGSDPDALTLYAIDALEAVGRPILADLVLGFGFSHFERLAERLAGAEGMYLCHFGVLDMASLIAKAHIALVAYGSSVYELAAAALPMVTICRYPEEEPEAARFAALGCAHSLGAAASASAAAVGAAIEELCRDRARRLSMARAGRQVVDGRGAERVADIIARAVEGRSVRGSKGGRQQWRHVAGSEGVSLP